MDLDRRYALGPLLGAGGMGCIYAAEAADGTHVAVKLLKPSYAEDPRMVGRLLDEALCAAQVSHPNVVRILDHGAVGGIPFLVMEAVDGVSLGTVLQSEGPLPLARIRVIAPQIVAGLGAIHRAGLVHGDIKSDNILLGPDDHVTIIDFGLARPPATDVFPEDGPSLAGTPEFLAPELIRGEPIGPSADVYAAVVILYEMLTGTTPFRDGSVVPVLARHLHEDPDPPSARCAGRAIPQMLDELVLRGLAKTPAARFADADDFARALRVIFWDDEAYDAEHTTVPAIPATTFSTTAPTITMPLPIPTGRLARGTAPPPRACHPREALALAMRRGEHDPIIAATLELAEALISGHQLGGAALELERVLGWFARAGAEPSALWRLQLTLAACYDGLHCGERARMLARSALAAATRAGSRVGSERARALMRRFDVARRASRARQHLMWREQALPICNPKEHT